MLKETLAQIIVMKKSDSLENILILFSLCKRCRSHKAEWRHIFKDYWDWIIIDNMQWNLNNVES